MSSLRGLSALLGGVVALSNSGCILLLLDKEEPPSQPPPQPTPVIPPPASTAPDPPPSVDRIVVPDWPPVGPESSVEITVTDNRSLSRVDLFFAKTSTRALSGSFSTFVVTGSSLGEGFGELVVRATDTNGGWAERSVSNLLVDLTPPTIQLFEATVPATGERAHVDLWIADAWVLGDVTLEFGGNVLEHDFSDGYPSTLGMQWDGSLVTFDASTLSMGRGTATVSARDAAGNVASKSFDLHIDGIAPIAKITSPASDAVVTGRFDVAIEASDALDGGVWVEVSVGGAPVANAAGSATLTLDANELPVGPTAISAIAIDEAGNQSAPATVTVNVTR